MYNLGTREWELLCGNRREWEWANVEQEGWLPPTNVRQRQKIISIIDYDVCILEYLQPFWRYSTSKNGLTLKSGYGE